MAFGSIDDQADPPMAEINMVPLIDVMLVLLLVFMITAPLLTHAIPVQLPRASLEPATEESARLLVGLDGSGQLFVDAQPIDRADLQQRLRSAAQQSPPPVLQLSADRATPYEKVAQVLADAARVGLTRVGFVTDPSESADDRPAPPAPAPAADGQSPGTR